MNNRIAAALESAHGAIRPCPYPKPSHEHDEQADCPWCAAHAAIDSLVREALEEAALTVLEDKPFSGLGLAAAIRALLPEVKP